MDNADAIWDPVPKDVIKPEDHTTSTPYGHSKDNPDEMWDPSSIPNPTNGSQDMWGRPPIRRSTVGSDNMWGTPIAGPTDGSDLM